MAVIDFALQVFVVVVPVWLAVSFTVFVIREEQAKAATKISEPSLPSEAPIVEKALSIDLNQAGNLIEYAEAKATSSEAQDSVDPDQQASQTEIISQTTPTIERQHLTLWTRRKEKVVPTNTLAFSIPDNIERLRWRNVEVIRLVELEQIVALV